MSHYPPADRSALDTGKFLASVFNMKLESIIEYLTDENTIVIGLDGIMTSEVFKRLDPLLRAAELPRPKWEIHDGYLTFGAYALPDIEAPDFVEKFNKCLHQAEQGEMTNQEVTKRFVQGLSKKTGLPLK